MLPAKHIILYMYMWIWDPLRRRQDWCWNIILYASQTQHAPASCTAPSRRRPQWRRRVRVERRGLSDGLVTALEVWRAAVELQSLPCQLAFESLLSNKIRWGSCVWVVVLVLRSKKLEFGPFGFASTSFLSKRMTLNLSMFQILATIYIRRPNNCPASQFNTLTLFERPVTISRHLKMLSYIWHISSFPFVIPFAQVASNQVQ